MTLSKQLKRFEKLIIDNSPTVLTGVGVAGTITTAILTGRASYKASDVIWEAEHNSATPKLPLDLSDKIKLVWTFYIPPVIVGSATIASIVMANRIGNRRAAAIAAAYAISEKAAAEYKDKVIEQIGEKREQHIRDEVAQDQVKENTSGSLVIVDTGEVLCYDSYSGRYFTSNVETINKAVNTLNHTMLSDMYASLTDWYNLIGLERTEFSDEVGWTVDQLLEISFSSVLTNEDKPCLSVNFKVVPIRDYYKF